jgi:hypothetical protein
MQEQFLMDVQNERYGAVPWMAKSVSVQDVLYFKSAGAIFNG